jgi:hypothetical protein
MLNLFNKNIKSHEDPVNKDKVVTHKSSTFFTTYFDTYELIKSDSHLFTPQKVNTSNLFGAFVNKTLNTTTENAIIKLGIPRLIHQTEETKRQIKDFQEDFDKFVNRYEITDTSQKDTQADILLPNGKVYKDLFCDSEVINTPGKKDKSVLGIILNNQPEKYIYYSNLLEDNVTLNPYTVINYEIDLQKCYSNVIYRLEEPKHIHHIYTYLIYLLQGVPSKIFIFNTKQLKFELSDSSFRLLTCNEALSRNFLDYFMTFGTKMYLIQTIIENYLYRNNDQTTFVIKQFYVDINTIIIKLNESLIKTRNSLEIGDLQSIGLYNTIEEYNSIITLIFNIFNLPAAIDKHKANKAQDLNTFILLYDEYNIRSHVLLNALFEIYYTFHIKSKDYYLVKSLLLSVLKSYSFYILKTIFNNELYDQHMEFFLLRSNNNTIVESPRVPKFLAAMKQILSNTATLINYINKLDYNYFSICNLKVNELLYYISVINFSEELSSSMLTEFMNLKNSIFNTKLELLYTTNEGYIVIYRFI